ncbi:MAG: dTMP kinase [Theionarchaea archaeon]|nr:dTMP kinase [Theionarchaea archaeon]
MKGRFIVFEGIDGSGKKTMCSHTEKLLTGKGLTIHRYEYPDYKSPWGAIIHEFLHGKIELDVGVQFLTYATDIIKDQAHMKTHLEQGWVISDRYITSTVAFQCAHGFPLEQAREFMKIFSFLKPDIIFFLKVNPETGKERKKAQKGNLDRHEAATGFLKEVNHMYHLLMDEGFLIRKWIEIDASRDLQQVTARITSEIENIIRD